MARSTTSGKGLGSPSCWCRGSAGLPRSGPIWCRASRKASIVVTHDHRGIGQSDLTRSGFTVDRMAADVIGLMDALEIERAHIVGHSTGGAIAQIAGDRAPETRRQHRAVGVLDQAGRLFPAVFRAPQGHPAAPRTQRLCAVQLAVPLSGLVRRPQQRAPASDGGADARGLSADRGRGQPASTRSSPSTAPRSSARIKTPTLVVGAEDDIITPAYFSEELARLIPGAEIKIFPRGGHALTQVRPREFSQAVLPFLASHTPA